MPLLGRVFNSLDSPLNGLKMAKSCQTSSNSGSISRYYLRYFPCLTAIYLIFIPIFEMKTRPRTFDYFMMKTRKSSAYVFFIAYVFRVSR